VEVHSSPDLSTTQNVDSFHVSPTSMEGFRVIVLPVALLLTGARRNSLETKLDSCL
jgi:hypothetical protein